MHVSKSVAVVSLAATIEAFSMPSFLMRRDACPQVWYNISSELSTLFLTDGQCNDAARAAIRSVFHDCFPQGGCDGSLALPDELSRPANAPLVATVNTLKGLAGQYSVGVADMLMFAGCE